MAKSTVEQICTAVRIVNMLDRRGKLAVLRDLQAQDLNPLAAPIAAPTEKEA